MMTPTPNPRPDIRRGRSTARLAVGAVYAALLASVVALPAGAQAADAFVAGAQAWTASDCTGDTPIIVGSDAAAQSDIYSAVTLAGVIDTDCVILAGPRNSNIPNSQQTRLRAAAPGGYIVGGTTAVPAAKTAGRDMTRLAGANRWTTAQRVGAVARTLTGDGTTPTTTLDASLSAPGDVAQPGLRINGAGPWTASDCTGDTPIIVGSDAAAQSDIYSAVTLAGAIDTDCVILAGPRNTTMPASQQTRLRAAAAGGYIVGGTAAVPAAKTAGRDMTRLAGANRWATAQLVGRTASGDTTSTETPTPAKFISVSVGSFHSCGLRSDQTATCWGRNTSGQTDAPTGKFISVSVGSSHSCGVRVDGTATCWGENRYGQADAPTGKFTSVSAGWRHSCGVRSDGTATCWGRNTSGKAEAPAGKFTSVSAGSDHSCGVRSDSTATCWGGNAGGKAEAPAGKFTSVSAGSDHSCGVRSDQTATCWGRRSLSGFSVAPTGTFTSVSAGLFDSCGVRSDGTATCWGSNGDNAPAGKFISVSASFRHWCGVRVDGTATCWGENRYGQLKKLRFVPVVSARLDTWDRDTVVAAYETELNRREPDSDYTGDVDNCVAGTTSQEFRDSVIQRVNWFRAMAGVTPVREDPVLSTTAQAKALIMAAAQKLSHDPGPDWPCNSGGPDLGVVLEVVSDGGRPAEVLTLHHGIDAIPSYMQDLGYGNTSVGHRRNLTSPYSHWVGTGDHPRRYDTSGTPSRTWSANAMHLKFDDSRSIRTRDTRNFVAWPPPGYVPYQVVWPRWSFEVFRPESGCSRCSVDVASATVAMTDELGPVDIEVIARDITDRSGFLVWTIGSDTSSWGGGLHAIPTDGEDCYTVTISGVRVGGAVQDPYEYMTCVIDPYASPGCSYARRGRYGYVTATCVIDPYA